MRSGIQRIPHNWSEEQTDLGFIVYGVGPYYFSFSCVSHLTFVNFSFSLFFSFFFFFFFWSGFTALAFCYRRFGFSLCPFAFMSIFIFIFYFVIFFFRFQTSEDCVLSYSSLCF